MKMYVYCYFFSNSYLLFYYNAIVHLTQIGIIVNKINITNELRMNECTDVH